ncbi:hypothetical protein J6590_032862 [Homalodisca vitripennis]|nr:hypothetical protein J6590_032862 [Homalodisca vitripennis]
MSCAVDGTFSVVLHHLQLRVLLVTVGSVKEPQRASISPVNQAPSPDLDILKRRCVSRTHLYMSISRRGRMLVPHAAQSALCGPPDVSSGPAIIRLMTKEASKG